MCRLHLFVLDSHLATLWESNCPFGFLLVMFPLGSSYYVFVFFFPFDVPDGRCGIIASIPDHCLPFYLEKAFDSISWEFIADVLDFLNFGPSIKK